MTIIAAYNDKPNSTMHIVADRMACDSSIAYENINKIVEFQHFYILFSGDINLSLIADEYVRCEIDHLQVNSKRDVINIYKIIETGVVAELGSKLTVHDDRDSLDSSFILVTKSGKIYTCSQFLNVMEYDTYVADGSGRDHAHGVLEFISRQGIEVTEQLLKEMMYSVYKFKFNCGRGVNYISFTY